MKGRVLAIIVPTFMILKQINSEKIQFFDVMELMANPVLPTEDKKRPAYGIKGPVLARLFAKALALDEVSQDGKKLLHYKDPVKAESSAGDLGSVIYSVMAKRQSGRSAKTKFVTIK